MTVTSNIIRIGTRASKLALAQVDEVTKLLQSHFPQIQIEVIKITTSGDKIQDRNLADIGGKGLFIKELEEALIQNKIDVAIHSAKDVPPILNETTELAAFTRRLEVFDCFISKKFNSLKELPKGAVIGTSSARRKAILLKLRPDLKIVNLRGNVDTRLGKIAKDEVDASILALCGLERLGKKSEIKEVIPTKVMLPSGGQGALALQVRKADKKSIKIVSAINHLETQICVKTERAFLRELRCSCVTPVAVYAHLENNRLNLETLILDYDGSEVFATESSGDFNLEDGLKLGVAAAVKTKESAAELLKRITD
jgi:hydroxymethylbilane synthase